MEEQAVDPFSRASVPTVSTVGYDAEEETLSKTEESDRSQLALTRYAPYSVGASLIKTFTSQEKRRLLELITEGDVANGFAYKFNSDTMKGLVRRPCSRSGHIPAKQPKTVTIGTACACPGKFAFSATGVLNKVDHNVACRGLAEHFAGVGVTLGAQFKAWRDLLAPGVWESTCIYAVNILEKVPGIKMTHMTDCCILHMEDVHGVEVPDDLKMKLKDSLRHQAQKRYHQGVPV